MQEYRGLSRIGKSLTAACGGAPAINTFDRKKRILMESYVKDVSTMVNENNGIIATTTGATCTEARTCPLNATRRTSKQTTQLLA